jgi:GAF domain-containing protein
MWMGETNVAGDEDARAVADVLAMLDGDPQGWVVAQAVRAGGRIVDFRLVYINEAGCRILGRSPGELVGALYRQLWPETVHDGTLPLYRDVVERRVPASRTVYYDRVSVSGHFEMRVGPFRDGLIVRFVDLSQVTVAPQSDYGTRLYRVLDAAFDGFTLLRAVRDGADAIVDFRCEYVNHIGAKLAGHTVEQLIGALVSEVASAGLDAGLFERYRQAAEDGVPWRQQVHYPQADQFWEIKIVPADVDFVAVSFRDITEQITYRQQIERTAVQARQTAERIEGIQAVTAALVAARTPHDVYAAMGSVVRPSAGGHGLVVLLLEADRLVLHYQAGYEPDVVEQLRTLPMTHDYPATAVARTGEPWFLHSPDEFHAAQPDPRRAVSAGGRQAWAFLPLATGGHLLGVLVVGYKQPHPFDGGERSTLNAFSGLCAQALQRALLHQAQASIATALQRALLPAALPQVRGARHAVRYLPWTAGADVGGDWYDVFAIGHDAVAVVIGDVAGHNTTAAAVMGQIRGAIRAYASEGHSPTAVFERVNQLLLSPDFETVATCCYLELHLAEGTATAVLAGHPPPVVRVGDHVVLPHLRVCPPLGVEAVTYVDTTFLVPAGATVLLYTDGLVEDRRHDLAQGLEDLRLAVGSAPAHDPDLLVDHVLSAGVGPHPRTDDVAILALTVDHDASGEPRHAQRTFHNDAANASAARRFAADLLTAWAHLALVDDTCLLLDEIITNAIQYTVGDVRVRLTLTDRLHAEVSDNSDRLPDKRPMDDTSTTGRGLHIVDRLATDWGVRAEPGGGKTVWFELPLHRP